MQREIGVFEKIAAAGVAGFRALAKASVARSTIVAHGGGAGKKMSAKVGGEMSGTRSPAPQNFDRPVLTGAARRLRPPVVYAIDVMSA